MIQEAAEVVPQARAVIYLRVSTRDQAKRGGEAEGFSIPAQREACLRQAQSLGAAVVAEFVDAGLLRRFELAGCAVYEPAHGYEPHDHLYCERCHRLLEFQSDELDAYCKQVAKKQRFQVTGRRVILYGICVKCAR